MHSCHSFITNKTNIMHNRTQIDYIEHTYSPQLASQLFAKIESQPWAMLLRSAASDHPNSRFDILVARPKVTLETQDQQTKITTAQGALLSSDDPFRLLEHSLAEHLPPMSCELDVPFIGGALGYFSYDLGRRVESIPQMATRDIDAPEMAIGLYSWALIVDHQQQKAYWVGTDCRSARQWLLHCPEPSPCQDFHLQSKWQSNTSEQEYHQKLARIQDYLTEGDCYQINFAQRFCAQYQGSEWQAYQRLEQTNQAPFSAFIRLASHAVLSVSPERFVQLRERCIETKPIKGTRSRSQDPTQDQALKNELMQAPKDQSENLMIVDLLRNDIGRVASPGSVRVPHLFAIESFPAVHHMVSTITAQLDPQQSATDLLRACFPGGSITGAPKVRAMAIIEELEPHRRSVYCGAIGYLSRDGQLDTNIAIRTLISQQQHLFAWAGGGIVADSQSELEYQETFDKLGKILPILSRNE